MELQANDQLYEANTQLDKKSYDMCYTEKHESIHYKVDDAEH